MAILSTCSCGADFSHRPGDAKWQCDECDGTNAAKRAEEARWSSLPADQKIEELKELIDGLRQQLSWRDMRF